MAPRFSVGIKSLPILAVHTVQREEESCYAGMLKREMGNLVWDGSAAKLERLIRGLNSWPGAYTFLRGKSLKLWDADVIPALPETVLQNGQQGAAPGTILGSDKNHIYVLTGDGILQLNEVQLEGHRRMAVHDFLLGERVCPGEQFTRERENR